jgi:tetratricopeptide (TPR) repeat protein
LLGPRHVEVGASLAGIATVLLELGRYDEAEAAYAEATAIWRGTGDMERNVALSTRGIADIALRRGDVDEALALYREALDMSERALGASHPELVHSLLGLAECERARGNPGAALPLVERAQEVAAADGVDPLERAKVALALARVVLETGGETARARDLAEQARAGAAGVSEFAESSRIVADATALLRG